MNSHERYAKKFEKVAHLLTGPTTTEEPFMSTKHLLPATKLPWRSGANLHLRADIISGKKDVASVIVTGSTEKSKCVSDEEAKQNEEYIIWAANNAPKLFARVEELEKALQNLVTLKAHKDANGKTPRYTNEQPKAWAKARELLGE